MPTNVVNRQKLDFPLRQKSENSNSSQKPFLPRHFENWLPPDRSLWRSWFLPKILGRTTYPKLCFEILIVERSLITSVKGFFALFYFSRAYLIHTGWISWLYKQTRAIWRKVIITKTSTYDAFSVCLGAEKHTTQTGKVMSIVWKSKIFKMKKEFHSSSKKIYFPGECVKLP